LKVEICSRLLIDPQCVIVRFNPEDGMSCKVDPPVTWKPPGFFPPPEILANVERYNAAQRQIISNTLDGIGGTFKGRLGAMALNYRTSHVILSEEDGKWIGTSSVTGNTGEGGSPLAAKLATGEKDWEAFRLAEG
jgi:hypothetical protein